MYKRQTVTCPGGLSQWGTVPLAEQGMTAEEIVRYYYGDDINIVRNAPIAPNLGGSWPGVTFRLGDVSEEVRTIQNRLNRISTNYPNIPKIYPVDGIYDADTERAVRAFQKQFNLGVDGIVGRCLLYTSTSTCPVSLSSSISTIPTMNGGGETGDECEAVACTAVSLPHIDLVAMSNSETSPVPSSFLTVRPANSTSSVPQPSMSAATLHRFSLSCAHAFSTALPVT